MITNMNNKKKRIERDRFNYMHVTASNLYLKVQSYSLF